MLHVEELFALDLFARFLLPLLIRARIVQFFAELSLLFECCALCTIELTDFLVFAFVWGG